MTDKYNIHLESRIGMDKLSSKQLEDIEFVIGSLNEHLESVFGCRIFYDTNIHPDSGEEMEESENDNTVNGFDIICMEEKENVSQAIKVVNDYLIHSEMGGKVNDKDEWFETYELLLELKEKVEDEKAL